MINYTERIGLLMADIVARVPTLSFIDMIKRAGLRASRPQRRRRPVRHLPLRLACHRASPAITTGAIAAPAR